MCGVVGYVVFVVLMCRRGYYSKSQIEIEEFVARMWAMAVSLYEI